MMIGIMDFQVCSFLKKHLLENETRFFLPPFSHSKFVIELSSEQRSALEKSKRIANPGCYPTGFIGLTAPLVNAGILPSGTPVTVNAISGYSEGGKALMQLFESEEEESEPWSSYAFGLVSSTLLSCV